ncbi:deoxyribonuclease IV [Streptomyces clavuligerus]|uniref:Probable endonuclease 4 n=1 Tax=Streptomyces clavuligerus TaxID=1901 RepID=B5H1Q2_STRCL|nr:deoxyribonuclease IV [Streptomyces clavuligerus]EDY52498.1 endonuclease IV [Streptomyces clavuligerus]EFG06406.1 Endonuclease IV [Streptomyces clavuligerus]MBY6305297.1 deoxyribonuclease IV [Streptomyces clavuligerus]QCS07998.1 deoxyribonuclease IV [Streptomyces clavuligerus]QPJ92666.1 deoxyribonuclease IV [Streptomyces clavuligerus]
MRNPVGGHVPVAGGLATTGLDYARQLGAEAVQVFVANPRGWATPPGSPAQDEAFLAGCAEAGLSAWVHAPYLINFGSHSEATAERSVESMRHSLRRAREIGARGVVVHTGSATGGRARSVALAQVHELVLPLLDELTRDDDPSLLLEPTAGQGASLCSRVEDLGPYFAALESHPRLGVCLDTCHVHAAGHDLAEPEGVAKTLDLLVTTVGAGRLRLIHANDSKEAVGSHKDRHANIGAGHIGADPFGELMRHPATEGVPLIIETPGGTAGHIADVERLKSLRG